MTRDACARESRECSGGHGAFEDAIPTTRHEHLGSTRRERDRARADRPGATWVGVFGVESNGESATRFSTRAELDAAATGFFVDATGFVWVKLAPGAEAVVVGLLEAD